MKTTTRGTLVGVLGAIGLSGCLADGDAGPQLQIEVASLTLAGIVEASYGLTVRNANDAIVWTKDALLSTRYGDGRGALTYIGSCDASSNPHTVELVLESLTSDLEGELDSPRDYVNPTRASDGSDTPVTITGVMCRENADTSVVFDLTIMRRAQQGFFDFAIEFEDIFCSAKLDCSPGLLHDAEGERAATAILGFACTSGQGDATYMYASDLVLTCVDPTGLEADIVQVVRMAGATAGQHDAIAPGIYAWAMYAGQELLGGADLDKCYRNVAIGLDVDALAGRACTLAGIGTASQEPLDRTGGGYQMPANGAYPYVTWSVQVLSAEGQLCTNHALDDSNNPGVTTRYVRSQEGLADLPALTATMTCGELPSVACSGTSGFGGITTKATDDGFELTGGRLAAARFVLPAGYAMGDACCASGCCTGGPKVVSCQSAGPFGSVSVRGTGSGFSLVAADQDVLPAAFTLPAGFTLGDSCCTQGCCGTVAVCERDSDFGTIAVVGTGDGFRLDTTDADIDAVGFVLPPGFSLAGECTSNVCCR